MFGVGRLTEKRRKHKMKKKSAYSRKGLLIEIFRKEAESQNNRNSKCYNDAAMKKVTTVTINGSPVEMTESQARELKRDGMVIVGDRIIRTVAYINRVHGKAGEMIADTARRVFR